MIAAGFSGPMPWLSSEGLASADSRLPRRGAFALASAVHRPRPQGPLDLPDDPSVLPRVCQRRRPFETPCHDAQEVPLPVLRLAVARSLWRWKRARVCMRVCVRACVCVSRSEREAIMGDDWRVRVRACLDRSVYIQAFDCSFKDPRWICGE